jgi:hypothetical protein
VKFRSLEVEKLGKTEAELPGPLSSPSFNNRGFR